MYSHNFCSCLRSCCFISSGATLGKVKQQLPSHEKSENSKHQGYSGSQHRSVYVWWKAWVQMWAVVLCSVKQHIWTFKMLWFWPWVICVNFYPWGHLLEDYLVWCEGKVIQIFCNSGFCFQTGMMVLYFALFLCRVLLVCFFRSSSVQPNY